MEFQNGLAARPILRQADAGERLIEGGTRVRVWLRSSSTFEQMLSGSDLQKPWTLEERCAWLCPALDVNLYVARDERKRLVVGASDWVSMKGSKLIQRLLGPSQKDLKGDLARLTAEIEPKLRLMKNSSGQVVGRACVFQRMSATKSRFGQYERFVGGVVTVGGFRSCQVSGICGVLAGKPHTAARNIGVPLAGQDVLRLWASEQAALIVPASLGSEDQVECAATVRALGGSTQQLHIAEDASGWKSAEEISKERIDGEVLIVQDAALHLARMERGEIVLHRNVFAVNPGMPGILQTERHDLWIDWPPPSGSDGGWNSNWRFHSRTLQGVVMEAIATAWGTPLAQVLKVSQQSTDKKAIEREIGRCNGTPVVLSVAVLRRPVAS